MICGSRQRPSHASLMMQKGGFSFSQGFFDDAKHYARCAIGMWGF